LQQSDPEAVSKLRRGVLLLIIDVLLIFLYHFLFTLLSTFNYVNQPFFTTLIGHFFLIASHVLLIVTFLAQIIITFISARSLNGGFRSLLSRWWGSIGVAGSWLLVIIASVFDPIIHLPELLWGSLYAEELGELVEFLAVLIVLYVAFLLIGIGLFMVGLSYNNKLLKIGGIVTAIQLISPLNLLPLMLLTIGGILTAIPLISFIVFIPLTSLIGLIISYVGLGRGP
jgi:hypothetical protein